jgi:predicted membrane channel-forming protein YqfA (hemolysin III family)
MHVSHFAAMASFALLISMALAALGQRSGWQRFRYAIWTFALFLLIGVGIAWAMFPFSR